MSAGRIKPGGQPRFSLVLHQIRILHQMRPRKLAGEAGGIARCLGWQHRTSEWFAHSPLALLRRAARAPPVRSVSVAPQVADPELAFGEAKISGKVAVILGA